MNRRRFAVSSSFLVGTGGGLISGGIAGAALAYDPRTRLGKLSYAQQGEDLIVESLCRREGIPLRTYLDIGAGHPIAGSNTYLSYLAGARGVLVEPNPLHCKQCRRARSRDAVLEAGIGAGGESIGDYYVVGDRAAGSQCNTFSREEAERFAREFGGAWRILEVRRVPLLDINRVISEYFAGAPDLISTDTEGFDLPILRSLDFGRFRPRVVCAEAPAADGQPIVELMKSHRYRLAASTGVNAIFLAP